MPEHEREDGARLKEIVRAWMNAGAALGAAALLGVGGYLLLVDDGVSPSGSTPSIESPEDAAPRSAADIDTRPPGVSPPAAERPTVQAAEDSPNLARANRRRSAEPAAPRLAADTDARAPGASPPAAERPTARTAEDSLNLARADRRRIQAGLTASGLEPGPADGMFGAGTRSAIRDWQAGRGSPATGYLNAAEAEELIALGRGRGEGRRAAARRPRADVEDSGGRLTVRAEPASRVELDGAAEDPTARAAEDSPNLARSDRRRSADTDARVPGAGVAAQERIPSLDLDLDENNYRPHGLWSDGTTMWVADESDRKLYAYTLSTKARDPDKDIDTSRAAGRPYGLWSDGTTMWVAHPDASELYGYSLATRARDPVKDFEVLGAQGNGSPHGLWSDGTTMWVADRRQHKLFAYSLATESYDAGKDFDTLEAAGQRWPTGIWSDGTTMWVADREDTKLYAYSVATKARDPGKDFDTLEAAGQRWPTGIWSDGATMWVATASSEQLYAYALPRDGGGVTPTFGSAAEGATARAAEDSLNLARADRRRIQAGLTASGLEPGPADGMFGAGTRSAIRAWQAGRGLPAPGYLNATEAEELIALGRGRGEGRRAEAPRPSAVVEDSGGSLAVRAEPASRVELDGAAAFPTARAAEDSPNRLLRRSFSCSQVSPPNPLFRAVKRGNVEVVTILADLCPEHLDTVHEQTFRLYETPLSLAVKAQAVELVRVLLEAGADPNTITENSFRLYETPLSLAVKAQAVELVRVLLEAGADPNTITENSFRLYETPLSLAVKAQFIEIVRILVDAGADPNESLQRSFRLHLSPLDIAIEEGYTEIANVLVGPFD